MCPLQAKVQHRHQEVCNSTCREPQNLTKTSQSIYEVWNPTVANLTLMALSTASQSY